MPIWYGRAVGGASIGLSIGSHLDFKQRTDLNFFNSDILESIFIEIIRPNLNNIIIGTIYRPPNADAQLSVFKLDELLNKLSKENKTSYLMGDFNIDILKYQQHNFTSDFLDTMFSHIFLPLINRPTRIASHTATIIDNIFTNGPIIHICITNLWMVFFLRIFQITCQCF